MTVLLACRKASQLMGLTAPLQVYGSTSRYEVELQAIANEAARAIAEEHDWRKLTMLQTMTGDGSDTAFDLPDDYDRMPVKSEVFASNTNAPISRAPSLDEWLRINMQGFSAPNGWWIILGGQMQIYPALGTGILAKFYYQSNEIVLAEDGTTTKTAFTTDTDSFRLNEDMLALEIIWRWRAMKGLEYAEDMQNAGIAKAQQISREKGSRILSIGKPRMIYSDALTYPGTISAS